jgi:hypothetical protein
MVCIWIASCAMRGSRPAAWYMPEDRVVQRRHDAARKDHQRLLQHAASGRRALLASGCASGMASTSGSRATAGATGPAARTGRVQHEAGIDLAPREAPAAARRRSPRSAPAAPAAAAHAEGAQPLGQQRKADRRHEGDAQAADGAAGGGTRLRRQRLRARQQLARLRQQRRAGGQSARRCACCARTGARQQRSSWAMACVSGGCVMCRRRAARPKCSSSATATNWRHSRSSTRGSLICRAY